MGSLTTLAVLEILAGPGDRDSTGHRRSDCASKSVLASSVQARQGTQRRGRPPLAVAFAGDHADLLEKNSGGCVSWNYKGNPRTRTSESIVGFTRTTFDLVSSRRKRRLQARFVGQRIVNKSYCCAPCVCPTVILAGHCCTCATRSDQCVLATQHCSMGALKGKVQWSKNDHYVGCSTNPLRATRNSVGKAL